MIQSKPSLFSVLRPSFLFMCLSLVLMSTAQAQVTVPSVLSDTEAVVDLINAASSEIVLLAPALTSREVAFALMQAAEQRGVAVLATFDAASVMAGGSFGPYLTLYTPNVRISGNPVRPPLMVIDRTITVEGPLVSGGATVFNQDETYAVQDTVHAAERLAAFTAIWQASVPFELTEEMLGGPQ